MDEWIPRARSQQSIRGLSSSTIRHGVNLVFWYTMGGSWVSVMKTAQLGLKSGRVEEPGHLSAADYPTARAFQTLKCQLNPSIVEEHSKGYHG